MRLSPALLGLGLIAAPALAQTPRDDVRVPDELTDPATMDRIGSMVGALSRAVMNMPVGEVEAAAEGRPATPDDRRRTVRDIAGPDAEENIEEGVATGRVAAEAGVRAMARAMPSIARAMEDVREEVERATANMPQPGYPRR